MREYLGSSLSRTRLTGKLPRRVRWILTIGGMCAGIGYISEPQQLLADAAAESYGSADVRGQFTQRLVDRLAATHALLRVQTRRDAGSTDIILWVNDDVNPGVLDRAEVAVLNHSRVLRALTWYEYDGMHSSESYTLDHVILGARQFADEWKSSTQVRPVIITTGVSDMAAHIVGSAMHGAPSLRIDLIWSDDSSDAPVRTSSSALLQTMRDTMDGEIGER